MAFSKVWFKIVLKGRICSIFNLDFLELLSPNKLYMKGIKKEVNLFQE